MHWRYGLDRQRFRGMMYEGESRNLRSNLTRLKTVSYDEAGPHGMRGRVPHSGRRFRSFLSRMVLFLDKGIAGPWPSSGHEVPKSDPE
jgi:hypothetical protein